MPFGSLSTIQDLHERLGDNKRSKISHRKRSLDADHSAEGVEREERKHKKSKKEKKEKKEKK
jgi:hypothetical protein